ncbi:MAG: zinc-ribbon domain-containing protein [Treponema sp.]|nr:zinc-ribbon domain-containing protein [Treponema sp.]
MMKFSSEQSPLAEETALKNTSYSHDGQNSSRFCTNCGNPLEDDDLFCSECGYKVEQEESAITIEEDEKAQEQKPAHISSDRMASILQTNRIKMGIAENDFRNANSFNDIVANAIQTKDAKIEKKSSLLGHYIHRDSYMTQYFIIESIQGNCVKALVKTIFDNGSYSNEFYKGTLSDGNLHLQIVDSDLHPLPDKLQFFFGTTNMVHHSIKLSENFDGTVREDAILGAFTGQFSKSVVFRKC